MKFTLLSISFMLISWLGQAQNSDGIVGIWVDESKESHIEIYKKGNLYFGKIHWIKQGKTPDGKIPTDQKNPNPNLRNRTILGLEIITDLKYKSGKWVDGKLYSPKRGVEVSCKFTKISNDKLKLTASKGIISKSQTWNKVK